MKHLRFIQKRMEALQPGGRLMIFLPPRSYKSETVTVRYTAWTLSQWPRTSCMIGCYNQTLANTFSRKVRKIAREHVDMDPERRDVTDWMTATGGGLRAAGVGSGVTGRGADCFPAGTMVQTEQGEIDIATLSRLYLKPRVLAFDLERRALTYRRIVSSREITANGLVEVVTTGGRRIRCTADHRFYVDGSGYREAALLCPGDRLITVDVSGMRGGEAEGKQDVLAVLRGGAQAGGGADLSHVREGIREASIRDGEVSKAGACGQLLFSDLQHGASCGEERNAMRSVWQAQAREAGQQILLEGMQGCSAPAKGTARMCMVRGDDDAEVASHSTLLAGMCGCGALGQDAGQRKLALQDRDQLCQVVCAHAPVGDGAGQPGLCGMWQAGTDIDGGMVWHGRDAHEPGSASHQRGREEQHGRESSHALQDLSWQVPQGDGESVAVVRKLCPGRIPVYDIQVEGDHNFFADGVLVHNCLIIDDPVRSRADANSQVYRDKLWNWYKDDLYTRLEPGARLVLIQTRWHEDDLAGRILEEEAEEGWEVIRMPALAETQAQRDEWADRHHRPLGEPDPIGRIPGAPLNPERFDLADIEQQRRIMGRSFQALMQQSPTELEGGMFRLDDWIEVNRDELPPMVSMVRSWDKAATQDGGKRTAGVLMGRSAQGLYFILDVVKGHWASAEREQIMMETADNDAATWRNRHIIVEQEPGSGGKDSAELSLINLSMYVAEAKRVTGDKETRAEPFAAAVGNGLVYVVRGQWTKDYKLEHASFPSGAYSDQVDASSGAYNWLAEQPLFRRKPGRTEVLGPRRKPSRQRKARHR